MNESMLKLLKTMIEKYGKQENILYKLDSKNSWKNDTYYEVVNLDTVNDLVVRDALVGQGRIIEEDLENHVYVDLLRIGLFGLSESLLATKIEGKSVHIIAYAKEGLFKQHLAKNAVQKVKRILIGSTV